IYDFINSNFFVTVVGGFFLWLVSTGWQENIEEQKEKSLKLQQIYQQRMIFIEDFSQNFIYKVTLLRDYKVREAWISKNVKKMKNFMTEEVI
ncbi:hypothetical protein ACPV51_26245, partial [Vibrio astriarenae]